MVWIPELRVVKKEPLCIESISLCGPSHNPVVIKVLCAENMCIPEPNSKEELLAIRQTEKLRYQNIKNNPKLYAKYKTKSNIKYEKLKAQKQIVVINEMSARQQKMQREKWREEGKRSHQRIKDKAAKERRLIMESNHECGFESVQILDAPEGQENGIVNDKYDIALFAENLNTSVKETAESKECFPEVKEEAVAEEPFSEQSICDTPDPLAIKEECHTDDAVVIKSESRAHDAVVIMEASHESHDTVVIKNESHAHDAVVIQNESNAHDAVAIQNESHAHDTVVKKGESHAHDTVVKKGETHAHDTVLKKDESLAHGAVIIKNESHTHNTVDIKTESHAHVAVVIKKELLCDARASHEAFTSLYGDHDVKDELVLGPECLQRAGAPAASQAAEAISSAGDLQSTQESPMPPTSSKHKPKASFKKHPCQTCGKEFKRATHLKSHMLTHTGLKPFTCEVCKKEFAFIGNLRTHKRVHTGEKPFSCEICNFCFTNSGALKMHRRIHTGLKPHSCDICFKTFRASDTLNRHKRTHTGEKPYFCEICKKRFNETGELRKHKRTHTGEKPFSCELCEKKFSQSSNLKNHKRTHTGEKPYACKVCGRKFSQVINMKKHEKIHIRTSDKPI